MLKVGKLSVLLVGLAIQMVGAPVVGVLNLIGDVEVSAPGGVGNIDFLPPVGGGTGDFLVSSVLSQEGDFIPLAGTTGEIKDLNQAAQPVGVPFLLSDFIVFDADPDIRFDLRFLNPGTFAGTPFNLADTPQGATASFSGTGDVRRVSTGEITPFAIVFSTQFVGQSVAELVGEIAAGGAVRASVSGEALVIPEPATSALIGLPLVLLGLVARRRMKHSS